LGKKGNFNKGEREKKEGKGGREKISTFYTSKVLSGVARWGFDRGRIRESADCLKRRDVRHSGEKNGNSATVLRLTSLSNFVGYGVGGW